MQTFAEGRVEAGRAREVFWKPPLWSAGVSHLTAVLSPELCRLGRAGEAAVEVPAVRGPRGVSRETVYGMCWAVVLP